MIPQHPQLGDNEPSQQTVRSFKQPQTPPCQEQHPLLHRFINLEPIQHSVTFKGLIVLPELA